MSLRSRLCFAVALISLPACSSSTGGAGVPAAVAAAGNTVQALLPQRVRHVFVIIQENHTFDNYFGLYPGTGGSIENLASSTAAALDCVPDPMAGSGVCQRPFLITTNKANTKYYVGDAPDIGGGGNSRFSQQYAIDGGKMDGFLTENETSNPLTTAPTPLPANPTVAQVQAHNAALQVESIYDCDTVPYLWYYAKNFALFDHYFQADTGQSTPGNVQLFAGQIGQTEVVAGKAPFGVSTLSGTGYTNGLPLGNDGNPPASNLSFITSYTGVPQQAISVASLPVMLNPAQDQAAISAGVLGLIPEDINAEAAASAQRGSVPWVWYEEGQLASGGAPAAAYSPHHAAPLYFDYINNAKSPFATTSTLKDNTFSGNGLLSDIKNGTLPANGVFWVKGAAGATTFPYKPADPTFASNGMYQGTDDHPGSGSSDHQVAEAFLAATINAIASSQYWNDSVIIVTWDDSGGMYDHFPPTKFGPACPDDVSGPFAGTGCGDGVRLPLLIISPFVQTGTVVNTPSDTGAIMRFIEEVFQLPTLASLPDELAGTNAGLGPSDANASVGDLSTAFSVSKLQGTGLNPASMAMIPSPAVPPAMSCASLGITPIPSPATPPPGFQTSGWYLSTTPQGALRRMPQPDDSGD